MVSKKEALILGLVVVGGLGAASMVAGDAGGGGARAEGKRAGGILGAPTYGPQKAIAPTVYQFAAQPAITFPEPPKFVGLTSLATKKEAELQTYYERQRKGRWMVDPMRVMSIMRGEPTIGKPSPATGIQPYPYTGGEVKKGAATVAPWADTYKLKPETSYAPATSLPAAMGIHTALEYARKPKGRGAAGVSAEPKKEVKE